MTVINDNATLIKFCKSIEKTQFITVDTEFLREHTYWPKLCLLQIAGPNEAVAIDPLAPLIDLKPIFELFKNPNIVKVFHASRQDLEIFFNLDHSLPTPIFDTQVAAMVCGFGDSISYENLVSNLTGINIDKSSRYTDWSHRPLSEKQIEYALSDVTHLRKVYLRITDTLDDSSRLNWIEEEMNILRCYETFDGDPYKAYKRLKVRSPSSRFLAILREVAAWREIQAQSRNIPRNRVLRDDTIVEIANSKPKNLDQLSRTRGLGSKIVEGKYGKEILNAIAIGEAVLDKNCPKPQKKLDVPRGGKAIIDILKVLLKLKCEEFNVAGKLIATATDIDHIAIFGENANVPALKGWRREIFGNDALKLKDGELYLTVKSNKLIVIAKDSLKAKTL